MTGSGLLDFLITIVVLIGVGALFFVAIDRLAPDPFLNKIAKIAIGVVLLVILLIAIKGVLFGGGAALSGGGIIQFAIGLIVILVILFLVDLALNYIGSMIGEPIVNAIRYVVFAVALIALLVLADRALIGGTVQGALTGPLFGSTPRIMR